MFAFLRRWYIGKVQYGLEYDLRMDLFRSLQHLDGAQQDRLRTGQVVSRSASDVTLVERLISMIPLLTASAVQFVAALVIMAVLSPILTSVALVIIADRRSWSPGAATGPSFPSTWDQSQRRGEVAGVVEAAVSGVRVVKGFGQEHREQDKLERAATAVFAAGMRVNRLVAIYIAVLPWDAGAGSGRHPGAWVAIWRCAVTSRSARSWRSPAYLGAMIGPLMMLTGQITQAQTTKAAAIRVFEIIDARPTITDAPDAGRRTCRRGPDRVRPRDLWLRPRQPGAAGRVAAGRPRRDPRVGGRRGLGQVDARHAPGEVLRPVERLGPAGWPGHPPAVDELVARGAWAWCSRTASCSPTRSGPTSRSVVRTPPTTTCVAAARAAEADRFVRGLVDGYDTVVGERGLTLSGGQRQRIALARAILADPRVLVLDDATSAVDAGVEAEIHATLRQVMQGRTTILIAHRRSTLQLADRIAVLHHGQVVDIGTHEELVGRCARYRLLLTGHDDETDAGELEDVADGRRTLMRTLVRAHTGARGPSHLRKTWWGSARWDRRRCRPTSRRRSRPSRPSGRRLTVDADVARRAEPTFSLRRLWQPFRTGIVLSTALVTVEAALGLAVPWLTRAGIDHGCHPGRGRRAVPDVRARVRDRGRRAGW